MVRAIALDSNFADAYALLADFYAWHSANFVENSGENLKHCEVAALNALRINPQSLEGLVALGGAYSEEGCEAEATRALRRAAALTPNHQVAWELLGRIDLTPGFPFRQSGLTGKRSKPARLQIGFRF